MSEVKISLTRATSLELAQIIIMASGEINYKGAREQVRRALLSVWPEIVEQAWEGDLAETRPVPFTEKQLRSMGEGFLSVAKDTAQAGGNFSVAARLADTLKISKWFWHHVEATPVEPLDMPLDDEPSLHDGVA